MFNPHLLNQRDSGKLFAAETGCAMLLDYFFFFFLWHEQLPLPLRRLDFLEAALEVNVEEQDTSEKGLPASLPLTRLSSHPPFH